MSIANLDVQAIDGLVSSDYHERAEVSNSMLSEFLNSPEWYHARYITKTIQRKPTTPAMQFGTLFHDAVLLGLDSQAVEIPASVLSKAGSRTGQAWWDFETEHAGRSLLKSDEYAQLRNMVEAVWSHPTASKLLHPADAAIEQSLFWTDEPTGLKLRARPDHRKLTTPIITDLKSTLSANRRKFAGTIYDFGYYRQAVFYREGAKALTGEVHEFVFVAVEKEPPHSVRCYTLDPREDKAMQRGYEDMRAGLDMLAEAYQTNNWHERGWDEVLTLDLPRWAYNHDWELANGNGD